MRCGKASKILLPGVGHFGQMMRALDQMQVRAALTERIRAGVPFLGICLGLQALFETSEEAPELHGLGIYAGTVRRFPAGVRVPHMGWNTLEARAPSRLLAGLGADPHVYFAHSYYVPETSVMAARATYAQPFTRRCSNPATPSACNSTRRNPGQWVLELCGTSVNCKKMSRRGAEHAEKKDLRLSSLCSLRLCEKCF